VSETQPTEGTAREVAAALGIRTNTVYNWEQQRRYTSSGFRLKGRRRVKLYDIATVAAANRRPRIEE
jgi:hypothetical protein